MAVKDEFELGGSKKREKERLEAEKSRIEPIIDDSKSLDIDKDETVEEAVTIEACLNRNTEKYYRYTRLDCAGASIAAKYIADAELANFVDCGCPDCDLEIAVKINHPSIYNGDDGSVSLEVNAINTDPASDNFGVVTKTGTANYTYVIAPKNNEDAGKGAGAPIGSGAVANVAFTFGYGVNLAQTGATGNPTYATSSAKGYVPAVSTSGTSTKGLTAGSYWVYVFDSNSDGSCLARKIINLENPTPLAGCTDNNTGTNDGAAFNYNANASIDDNSCLYCKSSDGTVVDSYSKPYKDGNILTDFYDYGVESPNVFNELLNSEVRYGDPDAWPDVGTEQCNPKDGHNCYRCNGNCYYHVLGHTFDDGSYATMEECIKNSQCTSPSQLDWSCMFHKGSPWPICIYTPGAGQYTDKWDCWTNSKCGDIADEINPSEIARLAATDSNNTDGGIMVSAYAKTFYMNYVQDVIDSNGELDAIFKIELYKLTETQYKDETISGGTKIGDTISNTWTIDDINGSEPNFFGTNPWMFIFVSLNGYDITYGRYGIKFFMDDPDNGELEQCYQTIFTTVPVLACPDEFDEIGTTSDGVVITDPELFIPDSVICKKVNNYCCDSPVVELTSFGPTGSPCDGGTIKATINCSPAATALTVQLLYRQNGTWIIIGSASPAQTAVPTITSFIASFGVSVYGPYGSGDYKVKVTSEFARSEKCVEESDRVTYTFPKFGCTDQTAINYNPAATCDDGSCIRHILGCMDPTAANYDSNATQDDGSCYFPVYGCTDPLANNFNPLATDNDGSCNYDPDPFDPEEPDDSDTDPDPTGCDISFDITSITSTDATASSCTSTNDDGTAEMSIVCLSTTKYQFRIIPAGGTPSAWYPYDATNATLFFNGPQTLNSSNTAGSSYTSPLANLSPGGYIIEAVQLQPGSTADTSKCPRKLKPFSIGANAVNCGCTDPAADNYDATATIDDGSCLYGGCTDPNAINYDPNATFDDGSCEYKVDPYPCIPTQIGDTIAKVKDCILEKGTNFYNAVISGRADDCSIMNAWKLLLIDHLIDTVGLDCIYNCADANTVDVTTLDSCTDIWVEGGVKTGLSDQGHAGSTVVSGEGTTITDDALYFVSTNTLYPGDVIKMDSANIWIANGPGTANLGAGQGFIAELNNPETAIGQANEMWTQCVQVMKRTSFTDSTNYLDNFITFVTKFCADCDISIPTPQRNGNGGSNSNGGCPQHNITETQYCGDCPPGYTYDSQDFRCEHDNNEQSNPSLICVECKWVQYSGSRTTYDEYL